MAEPASSSQHDQQVERNAQRVDPKWWVLLAIGIGTFMTALDTSVVNTILPIINQTFRSDIASVEWVVIIYLLLVSGMLLSFGRLGDLRGHRPIYLAGFFGFILSSVLCGLAPSTFGLVVFRGLQALGAAMLSANSPAILTKSFPASQRGQALGLQATMTYLGLTVGPSLGGWLTDQFSWRAVFYINIPVGLLALALSWRFVPRDAQRSTSERFDLPGAVIFMAGLVALLLGLNQGHNWGWTSLPILGLLAAALALLGLFIWVELRSPHPMLDLRLFNNRLFSATTGAAVLNYICVYTIIFIMPFYLIQARDFSASQAGLLLTAMPITMAILAPLSGTLSDKIGARLPSTFGMLAIAAGLFLLSRLGPNSSHSQIVLSLAAAGVGIGVFISPNTSALMGAAPRNRQGVAAGVMATARNVGMVLGIGFAGAVFTTILSRSSQSETLAIFPAAQAAFLAAIAVAALGALVSVTRGSPATVGARQRKSEGLS
jgi:EmrB/QacA subfamily drug resistance transporter